MGFWSRAKTFLMGEPEEEPVAAEAADETPAVSIPRSTAEGAGKVMLIRPDRYVEAGRIADCLCSGYTVLLDLESVTRDASRRIVDFLSGAAYGRDGQMLRVAANVYLLAPCGVEMLDGKPEADETLEYPSAFGF